jgi:hypothetical protein
MRNEPLEAPISQRHSKLRSVAPLTVVRVQLARR